MPDEKLQPASEITKDNVKKDAESGVLLFDDASALKIVLDDTSTSDQFISVNNWAARWTDADEVYQNPEGGIYFDGGLSHVPVFTVSNQVNALVPKMVEGLFYGNPPFLLLPAPNTDPIITRAKAALFTLQLNEMKWEEECERGLFQMALMGTCIFKWGWLDDKKKVKKYIRVDKPETVKTAVMTHEVHTEDSDDFEIKYEDKDTHRPWIKFCDLREVLVDTGCRVGDIRHAKRVVHRSYPTFAELDALRNVDGYDIPSEAVLKDFFMQDKPTPGPDNIALTLPEGMRGYMQHGTPRNLNNNANPLDNGLEMLEWTSPQQVIVVLKHGADNILIRNEENPFDCVNYFSANWRDIQDAFYGQGLGLLTGADQAVESGIKNMSLDVLAKTLIPNAVRKRGFNTPSQDIRLTDGGIIDVDPDVAGSAKDAFDFLKWPGPDPAAMQWLSQAHSAGAETSGANDQVSMGASSPGQHSTGMRSGTGAQAVIAANASRLDGPAGRFMKQVFIPWIYQMDELNNDLLPASTLREYLAETEAKDLKVDHIAFRNAKHEYDVLGGAKLGQKAQMAQFLPFLEQMLINPTLLQMVAKENKKWSFTSFFDAMSDLAGWKFNQNFLVDMSPEEIQRAKAESPAAMQQAQAKSAQALEDQKFQNASKLQSELQLEKAGGESLRQVTEKALTPELVTGEAGGTGLGSTAV